MLDPEQGSEGAAIELLGTAGPDAAIASVRRVRDGQLADDADLVLLDLSHADADRTASVLGNVTDTSGSAFSFATDLVAGSP